MYIAQNFQAAKGCSAADSLNSWLGLSYENSSPMFESIALFAEVSLLF